MEYMKDPETQKVYFATTADGKPKNIQRSIYAEVFYIMGKYFMTQSIVTKVT